MWSLCEVSLKVHIVNVKFEWSFTESSHCKMWTFGVHMVSIHVAACERSCETSHAIMWTFMHHMSFCIGFYRIYTLSRTWTFTFTTMNIHCVNAELSREHSRVPGEHSRFGMWSFSETSPKLHIYNVKFQWNFTQTSHYITHVRCTVTHNSLTWTIFMYTISCFTPIVQSQLHIRTHIMCTYRRTLRACHASDVCRMCARLCHASDVCTSARARVFTYETSWSKPPAATIA